MANNTEKRDFEQTDTPPIDEEGRLDIQMTKISEADPYLRKLWEEHPEEFEKAKKIVRQQLSDGVYLTKGLKKQNQ